MLSTYRHYVKWTRSDAKWLRVYLVNSTGGAADLTGYSVVAIGIAEDAEEKGAGETLLKDSVALPDDFVFPDDLTLGYVDILLKAAETSAMPHSTELVGQVRVTFDTGEVVSSERFSFISQEGTVKQ